MYNVSPDLTKQLILSYISEEAIFKKYLGDVNFQGRSVNPFRVDNKPTCEFYLGDSGSLFFVDRAGFFFGDCFAVAQKFYACRGEVYNYKQILEKVVEDMQIEWDDREIVYEKPQREIKILRVKRQEFTKEDLEYWAQFCITPEILRLFGVSSCQYAWLNDNIVYAYDPKDPGYIYHYGDYDYKIYFPKRKEIRFLCNTNKVQGLSQLPSTGEFLIITKSLKDVMVLHQFGIPAIAPQAETNILSKELLKELSTRFNQIFTNFDFDRTGLKASFRMFRENNIPMLLLTNGKFHTHNYGAKDIAEYIHKFGKEKTLQLIRETYNKII